MIEARRIKMNFGLSVMKLIGKYAKTALKKKELKKVYMKLLIGQRIKKILWQNKCLA